MKSKKKLVISVDFDGSMVKNEWPLIGDLRFGAVSVLRWLKRRGHSLILNTCREGRLLKPIIDIHWGDYGIQFDHVNENTPERIRQYGGDCRKISADWYIDDRAGFLGWWSIPFIILWLERTQL